MFSAYHREGYRASMEAKVEEFLADEDQPISSEEFFVWGILRLKTNDAELELNIYHSYVLFTVTEINNYFSS